MPISSGDRTTVLLLYPDSQAVRLVLDSKPLSILSNDQLVREYAEFAADLGKRHLDDRSGSSVPAAVFSHLRAELVGRLGSTS